MVQAHRKVEVREMKGKVKVKGTFFLRVISRVPPISLSSHTTPTTNGDGETYFLISNAQGRINVEKNNFMSSAKLFYSAKIRLCNWLRPNPALTPTRSPIGTEFC